MVQPEERDHSFVVKIWLEEPARDGKPAIWRGRITHVQSGESRYFQSLRAIGTFIRVYLARMGVKRE